MAKKSHPSRDPVPLADFTSIFENHITSAVLVTANIICYFQFQAVFEDLMCFLMILFIKK
jgi:hypothetical protein